MRLFLFFYLIIFLNFNLINCKLALRLSGFSLVQTQPFTVKPNRTLSHYTV